MAYLHTVPIHLETEETFLLNLSGRQCLLLGSGISMGSLLVGHVPNLGWGLVLGGLCFCMLAIIALTRIAGRFLEVWAIVWLLYHLQPSRFLWAAVPPDGRDGAEEANRHKQLWEDNDTWENA